MLFIQVQDNGPGLPDELLEKGLRAYASAQPGRALSLCSVERFTRNLNGRLELSNLEAGGARAAITLPLDAHRMPGSPP